MRSNRVHENEKKTSLPAHHQDFFLSNCKLLKYNYKVYCKLNFDLK